jgi:hypothetical protein
MAEVLKFYGKIGFLDERAIKVDEKGKNYAQL